MVGHVCVTELLDSKVCRLVTLCMRLPVMFQRSWCCPQRHRRMLLPMPRPSAGSNPCPFTVKIDRCEHTRFQSVLRVLPGNHQVCGWTWRPWTLQLWSEETGWGLILQLHEPHRGFPRDFKVSAENIRNVNLFPHIISESI